MGIWKNRKNTASPALHLVQQSTGFQAGGLTYSPGNVVAFPSPQNAMPMSGLSGAFMGPPMWQSNIMGGISGYSSTILWPWTHGELSPSEVDLIVDFKTRHPDFDTFTQEVGLILAHRPGLKNTPLFITLLYDLAKDLRKLISDYTSEEKIAEVLDGPTEENTRTK